MIFIPQSISYAFELAKKRHSKDNPWRGLSAEDIAATARAKEALKTIEVELVDHIIVADRDYISMTMSAIHDPLKDC